MGFVDLFKPTSSWSAEEVRRFLQQHSPEDYHLLDVRQPPEYEKGHLPGAQLVPMDRLEENLDGLDRGRVIVAY